MSHERAAAAGTLARRWMWLAAAAALLSAAGSLVGLLVPSAIYGRETIALADQAAAQDLVNLLVVAPLTVILGWRAHHGHRSAYLVWLGCLTFTVYNYAIYTVAIHFGPLFLLWTAVLGLSFFVLVGSLATTDLAALTACVAMRPAPWPAWLLIVSAALFAALWLTEIVPDLLAGAPSTSAGQWNVPTNPVHVLDLAFFLPAVAISGIQLLRRHRWGYATAAGLLTWLALTCLPIMITPVVGVVRVHDAAWTAAGPVGLTLLASAAGLAWLLRTSRPEHR